MIPQHREEPLYQRELFRLASADCLRPGGVELTERGLAHCAFGVGERVADLGCGPGVTLALLAERGLSPVGMDHSAAMLQEAERRLSGVPLLAGTLEDLPFRDACMDGIACECVLSLSYTPERALGEMGRVLRPGGRLLLTDIVVREGSHGAGGQGCARGAVPADVVAERLARQGFRILASEDHSRLLGELAGRLLFQGVLIREGYCCSQLLVLLVLQQQGVENPGLVRAAGGLCHGMGQSGGACGLLTGGAAALGYLACKGAAGEAAHPMAEPLINDYAAWFAQHVCTGGCRDVSCPSIQEKTGGGADMTLCGDLLAECWDNLVDLCAECGIDMTEPR